VGSKLRALYRSDALGVKGLALADDKEKQETRRALAQLYSSLSLQHAGFGLALAIGLITILTDYRAFLGIGNLGLDILFFLVAATSDLIIFELGKAGFFSLMTTKIVSWPLEVPSSKDWLNDGVTYYRNKAAADSPSLYRLGWSYHSRGLKLFVFVGLAGFGVALLLQASYPALALILQITGLVLSVLAGGIQLSTSLYSVFGIVLDRMGRCAMIAKRTLEKEGKLGSGYQTNALLKLAGADPLLRHEDLAKFKGTRTVTTAGAPKSNLEILVMRDEVKPEDVPLLTYKASEFEMMYQAGMAPRQTRLAVLMLTFAVGLQFFAWLLA